MYLHHASTPHPAEPYLGISLVRYKKARYKQAGCCVRECVRRGRAFRLLSSAGIGHASLCRLPHPATARLQGWGRAWLSAPPGLARALDKMSAPASRAVCSLLWFKYLSWKRAFSLLRKLHRDSEVAMRSWDHSVHFLGCEIGPLLLLPPAHMCWGVLAPCCCSAVLGVCFRAFTRQAQPVRVNSKCPWGSRVWYKRCGLSAASYRSL